MAESFSSKNKRVPKNETNQKNWIPEEIQYSILPNLPAKSLLRFKCVSKSLSVLISDLNFIDKTPKLILYSISSVFLMDYKEGSAKARRLDLPTKTEAEFFDIRACCNGILWIAVSREEDILWNPLTRECKIMPIKPSYSYIRDITKCLAYGFGYDLIRKDYQIIIIPEHPSIPMIPLKPLIYSVAKDSWETLEDPIPRYAALIYYNKKGISMKSGSVVYWPVLYYCDGNTCVVGHSYLQIRPHWLILGFDLVHRRHILLRQPPGVNHECNVKNLIDFKGSLCAIKNYETERIVEMWLFKEEMGKQKYWVKLMSIDLAALRIGLMPQIYLARDEEFLIRSFGRHFINERIPTFAFYAYNSTDKSFRNIEVPGTNWDEEIAYNESLASIQSQRVLDLKGAY